MPNTALLNKLRELHEQLAEINNDLGDIEQIDDETLNALEAMVAEAGQIVDQAKVATQPLGEMEQPFDLNARIEQFETRHPRVTSFLSQLTDLLAMMGI